MIRTSFRKDSCTVRVLISKDNPYEKLDEDQKELSKRCLYCLRTNQQRQSVRKARRGSEGAFEESCTVRVLISKNNPYEKLDEDRKELSKRFLYCSCTNR